MKNVFSPDSILGSMLEKIWDLFLLNLLTLLCCIPIVTAGSAITALYSTCFKLQTDSVSVFKTYFLEFRSNFKRATAIWFVLFLFFQIIAINYVIIIKTQPSWGNIAKVFLIILAVLTVMTIKWSLGLQAYFTDSAMRTVKNGVLLSLGYLFISLAMLALDVVPVVLILLVDSNLSFFLALLYGLALPGYISCLLMKRVFVKLQKTRE